MPLFLKVLKNVKFPMVRLYPYVICHKVIPLCHFKWSDSCISYKLIITSIVLMDLYLMFCQNYYIILLCTYIRRYIKNWWSLFMMLSSVQFSHSFVSNSLQPHESLHARPPCPSPTPGVYSNSCPSSRWCHPAISSSVVPFSSCPQYLPASGSFPVSQLFTWGDQSTGVSASASVLPLNTQDLSPSGWTGWISLQSEGLSRVFSNTIVQKHQFFGAQISSQSNSHIHTWPLEKP